MGINRFKQIAAKGKKKKKKANSWKKTSDEINHKPLSRL